MQISWKIKLGLPVLVSFLNVQLGFCQFSNLYTADRELSSSLINDVHHDHNDVIWIATDYGLNRYDGSKFVLYQYQEDDSASILHNMIKVIFEDSQNRLFIGYFNGLQLYDHATDSFTEIPILIDEGQQYPSHVLSIMERDNGEVLVGTSGQGVLAVDFSRERPVARPIKELIPSNFIKNLYEDKQNNLWIATEDKGLLCLDSNHQLKSYFQQSPSSISSVCEDAVGNVFSGSMNDGLHRYDPSMDKFEPVHYSANPQLPVKTLYRNQQDKILIGTDGNGLKIYDPDKQQITDGDFNVVTFDFSKSKVHSIIEDKLGNTWVGIFQKGVMMLPSYSSKFQYIGYKSIARNWIGSNSVTAVLQDDENVLWVGTDNDGLYSIGPEADKSTHYSHSNDPSSAPSTILTLLEDSEKNLWLGSYLQGMSKFNRKSGKFEYLHTLVNINENELQRVFSIVEDNNKHLWMGTMGNGLYSMNPASLKITRYDAVKGPDYHVQANSLHNNWINILLPVDDKIYIGTADGLGCLDLKTNSFTATFSGNRILPGQFITSLSDDKNGNIWVGTSEGLKLIDIASLTVTTFTTSDGLCGDLVRALQKDERGALWISTNHGISKLNLQDTTFTNYYAKDGLQGNEFSRNAAFINDEGKIFLGGINGLTYFHPSEIFDQRNELKVRITDFYIQGQPVRKGDKSGPYPMVDTSIFHASKIHLSHRDNSFGIEFSTFDFSNPDRITYSYAMNSEEWITLQPGTQLVNFNNLSPGNYHFRVKAMDFNLVSAEKSLHIKISPPWYWSPIARIIYGFLLLAIGFVIAREIKHRKNTRQKMMEHQQAEQINAAKLQLYTNISHDIRTPLSLIANPLKKLMKTDAHEMRQKDYRVMERNVERILLLMDQLMDVRKIDKGQMKLNFQETDMVEYTREISLMFEEKAQAKNIQFHFKPSEQQIYAWIDPNNFDKVITNVLANAFRFTPVNGNINFAISKTKQQPGAGYAVVHLQLVISDTGPGIEEQDLGRVFERFYQANNSQSNAGGGTGVGLHLSRSITELHHGSITAINNKDVGCSFIIRLPLGENHLPAEALHTEEVARMQPATRQQSKPVQSMQKSTSEKKKRRTKTILIVDDDAEIRDYVGSELQQDYHVLQSENGREALSVILDKLPDLVISDVMMPEMDGIELCRKLKHNVNINHIPVILLTARAEDINRLEGLEKGADAYILKPFNLEVLQKTVENILRNREILRKNFSGNQQQKDKIEHVSIQSADEKLLGKITDVINDNMSNQHLSVEMIAGEVGISRVHLHRKLKQLTGQSTRDFIKNVRLQQAARIFSSRKIGVAEVAYAVGFSNLPHFSNLFKEQFGIPPTAYCDKHHQQGTDAGKLR